MLSHMKAYRYGGCMGRIVLDLHRIYDDSEEITAELERVINTAVEKKIHTVEIIPGKGSGALRRHVMRFLNQPRIKDKYHRMEVNEKNHGKLTVHFRFP